MIARRIAGANRWLGAPGDWRPDKDGDCGHLAIRTAGDPRRGQGWCESAWEPTPAELDAIKAGGSIVLRVWGWQPPVALYVEPPPVTVPLTADATGVRPAPVEGGTALVPNIRVSKVCERCDEPVTALCAFCTLPDCPLRPALRGEPSLR